MYPSVVGMNTYSRVFYARKYTTTRIPDNGDDSCDPLGASFVTQITIPAKEGCFIMVKFASAALFLLASGTLTVEYIKPLPSFSVHFRE
jgi:hypothetical protein